jgi:hypothetical protein
MENLKEIKTNYKEVKNEEKNGIELYFEAIPSYQERQILKANGYKWNNKKACWYIKANKQIEPIKTGIHEKSNGYCRGSWTGNNYNGNLSLKEIAKIIKNELKRLYPDVTFSITSELYSMGQSLHISLMSAKKDIFKTFEQAVEDADGKSLGYARIYAHPEKWEGLTEQDLENSKRAIESLKHEIEKKHVQINQYHIDSELCVNDYGKELLKKAYELATSFNYDDSDGQIDYFDTNFYLHLNIGKWNKPFEVVA